MPTLKDVVKLARSRGLINIDLIAQSLQISEDQACRALKACWDRGLLMPVLTAYFAEPIQGKPAQMGVGGDAKRRAAWYRPEVRAIEDMLDARSGMGVTVREVVQELRVADNRARNALSLMVETGVLVKGTASAGGAYGHRPLIFGRDLEAIAARDQLYLDKASKKRKSKPKRGRPGGKTSSHEPRTIVSRVDMPHEA